MLILKVLCQKNEIKIQMSLIQANIKNMLLAIIDVNYCGLKINLVSL